MEEQRRLKKAKSDDVITKENEIPILNSKKVQLENAIVEYLKESDKYALEAESKENLELLKLSNSLKRAAKEKQEELEQCIAKKPKLTNGLK